MDFCFFFFSLSRQDWFVCLFYPDYRKHKEISCYFKKIKKEVWRSSVTKELWRRNSVTKVTGSYTQLSYTQLFINHEVLLYRRYIKETWKSVISHLPKTVPPLWFCFSASKIPSGIKTMTKLYTLKPLTGTERKFCSDSSTK